MWKAKQQRQWKHRRAKRTRTVLSLDDGRLHLVQILLHSQLLVFNHFLLFVNCFLYLLTHDLWGKTTGYERSERLSTQEHVTDALSGSSCLLLLGLLLVFHHLLQLVVGSGVFDLQLLTLDPQVPPQLLHLRHTDNSARSAHASVFASVGVVTHYK